MKYPTQGLESPVDRLGKESQVPTFHRVSLIYSLLCRLAPDWDPDPTGVPTVTVRIDQDPRSTLDLSRLLP